MQDQLIFNIKADISNVPIPEKLNNPFGINTPQLARIASSEFQEFITIESQKWDYNFSVRQGKMFGVLVVQKEDDTYGYLGTVSGKISRQSTCPNFAPSVFDDSTDDYFINRDMTELSVICNNINACTDEGGLIKLKEHRKQYSYGIQKRIFENSHFINTSGIKKNVLEIFHISSHGQPPAAAGECAAPKLLQYAFENQLKPIAIAEFWGGNPIKTNERVHKAFSPACKNKCRPILEYMLDNHELYTHSQHIQQPKDNKT